MSYELGKKIRLLRLSKGMTQEQLAEKLCVTPQSVSKWENDVTAPDIQLLPQLSVELGVTIDELFSITDEVRLQRIENLLNTSSENTVISEPDFDSYRAFLTEHIDDPKLKGRVLTVLATLYNQQAIGFNMKAAEYAIKAIEFEPEKKYNHSSLRIAWHGADRDWYAANNYELINFYLDFIEKHPENIPALQLLLDNLISDHRAEEAEYVLAKLRLADKNSCRSMYYEAQISRIRGDAERCESILEQMTEEFKDDWLAWSYRGDCYARYAQYDKACECWSHSYEMQPSPKLIDDLLCLAQVSVIKRDYKQAADRYRQAIAVLKNDYSVTEGDTVEQFNLLADKYSSMK